MVLWFLGTTKLSRKLQSPIQRPLNSRIRLWQKISDIDNLEDLQEFITDGFKQVGASGKMITDSRLSLLFNITKGNLGFYRILLSMEYKNKLKKIQTSADKIIEEAILECTRKRKPHHIVEQ